MSTKARLRKMFGNSRSNLEAKSRKAFERLFQEGDMQELAWLAWQAAIRWQKRQKPTK